jgi:hypothetical protein
MMIYGVFEHVAMNKPVMAALIAAGTAFLASLVSFLSWWRIHADRWSIRWPGRSDPVDLPHGTHLMVEAKPRPEDVGFLRNLSTSLTREQLAYRTESFLAYSCEPLMGLQSRAPLVGRGEELATSAISSLQRTCVGAAKALCLCAQYRRRPILEIAGRLYLKPLTFKHLPSTRSSASKKSGASKITR